MHSNWVFDIQIYLVLSDGNKSNLWDRIAAADLVISQAQDISGAADIVQVCLHTSAKPHSSVYSRFHDNDFVRSSNTWLAAPRCGSILEFGPLKRENYSSEGWRNGLEPDVTLLAFCGGNDTKSQRCFVLVIHSVVVQTSTWVNSSEVRPLKDK